MEMEAGGRRQEAGGRRQEAGVRDWGSGECGECGEIGIGEKKADG
jgi:hypothetical protein